MPTILKNFINILPDISLYPFGYILIRSHTSSYYCRIHSYFLSDTFRPFSKVAILVNGSRTDFFKPSRGIRQGGPISPYIYLLCMEDLSNAIHNAILDKTWKPIKIAGKGPKLSYLFFADD